MRLWGHLFLPFWRRHHSIELHEQGFVAEVLFDSDEFIDCLDRPRGWFIWVAVEECGYSLSGLLGGYWCE